MFPAIKESVYIVILSLVSLTFSRATRMTVISVFSTDAESLSLISTQLPPPPLSHHLNRLYSTCCRLVENEYILLISVSVFPFPPEASLSCIRMVVVPMGRVVSL